MTLASQSYRLGLLLAIAWLAVECASCGPGVRPETGDLSVEVLLPSKLSLPALTFRLSGEGIAPILKTMPIVGSPATTSALFTMLPAGREYSVTVTALSTDGTTTCVASGKAVVPANHTTILTVPLQCTTPNGSAVITVGFECRLISSLVIAPVVAAVGANVAVTVEVNPDGGGTTFSWTATSGTFRDPTAAKTTFVCSTPGTASITLTATSGVCSDHLTLSISCVPAA